MWTITSNSFLWGWKNQRCLILLNKTSTRIWGQFYIKAFINQRPFWCISTSPGNHLLSTSNVGWTLKPSARSLWDLLPLISTKMSCLILVSSTISFFCCSLLFPSFFRSVICFEIILNLWWLSAEWNVMDQMNVTLGSSKGWEGSVTQCLR